MTELSGTLDGVGLPAIIRFLTSLKKTGRLQIGHDDWQGEIIFDAGKLTGASLGSRHGLSALDGLVESLPGGTFAFDTSSRPSATPSIDLSPEALQAHLDTLVARIVAGKPSLPSVDSVPELIAQGESGAGEDPLPLDRGTLQTLLAVDGQRTVREIVAHRGSLDALWQLGNLAAVGLVRLETTRVVERPTEPDASAALPAEPATHAPAEIVEPPQVVERCPKLGFDDDPGNSFGRPTRLHRCFAAATPLPLSLDHQRELCLSDQFGTCPRLTMIGRTATRPSTGAGVNAAPSVGVSRNLARNTAAAMHVGERSDAAAAHPEAEDPRIVRLPVAGRHTNSPRGGSSERPTGGSTEPTQLRSPSASFSQRTGDSARPTPLRARIERVASAASPPKFDELTTAPSSEPRVAQVDPARALLEAQLTPRRDGVPVRLIAVGAVVLTVVAVIAYLVAPHLGEWFGDDNSDLSAFPNANAVALGTPVTEIAPRPTPFARATSAAAAPTVAPEAAPATVEPTAVPKPPTTVPAPTLVMDERFTNNARNWPSNAQGTTWLTSGGYRLITRQPNQFVAVDVPITDVFQDVVVSATFRKLGGTPAGGGFGIILRDASPTPLDGVTQGGQYYALEVGDKGEVGIWRRDVDHWVDLLTWQHADAVRPGTATNDLVVSAIGNRLTMAVNGTQVATLTDTTLPQGRIALLAGGDGNQIAVDHLSIQTP